MALRFGEEAVIVGNLQDRQKTSISGEGEEIGRGGSGSSGYNQGAVVPPTTVYNRQMYPHSLDL